MFSRNRREFGNFIPMTTVMQSCVSEQMTVHKSSFCRHMYSMLVNYLVMVKYTAYSSSASLIWEITCCMGPTALPATCQWWLSPPLPQSKLVLDLSTPEGCKAQLTWVTFSKIVYLPKNDHLSQKWPGSVTAASRTHDDCESGFVTTRPPKL